MDSRIKYNRQHSSRIQIQISDTSETDAAIVQYLDELVEEFGTSRMFELKRMILDAYDKKHGTDMLDQYILAYKIRGYGKNADLHSDRISISQ